MTKAEEKLQICEQAVQSSVPFQPKVALVLGSGLGAFADEIRQDAVISYRDIPGFPVSTVPGHGGRFVFGYVDRTPVVIMQGRVHYYEGYSMEDVVLPIRLMRRMGAEILCLTNAAGGLNRVFRPGDLMLITDQIASFVPSPLIGPNADSLGIRFPDMSNIYDVKLNDIIRSAAREIGLQMREGVYVQTPGPQYESPAEVRMYRTLGGSAVGMSTAVEAIAAVHAGFRVCGISCITNPASGISTHPLSHEEVEAAAAKTGPVFRRLLWRSISRMMPPKPTGSARRDDDVVLL